MPTYPYYTPIPYPGDGANGEKQGANASLFNSRYLELALAMGNLGALSGLSTDSFAAAIVEEMNARILAINSEAGARTQADDALDDRIDNLIITDGGDPGPEVADARGGETVLSARLAAMELGIYNVRREPYGATGDGVTNDQAAISAAALAAYTAGGGIVWIPAGEYVADSITTYPNVYYYGAGRGKTIIRKTSSSPTGSVGLFHMAEDEDIENVVISDMSFEQFQSVSGRCIWLWTSTNVIRNVHITRVDARCSQDMTAANAIQIGSGSGGAICYGVEIKSCYIEAAANAVNENYALYISHAAEQPPANTSVIIENNEIVGGREGYTQGDSGTANVLFFMKNTVHGQTRRGAHFYHGQYTRAVFNTFYNITGLPFPGAGGGNDGGAVWMDVAAPGNGYRTSEFSGNVIRDCIGNGLFNEEMLGCTVEKNTIINCAKRSTAISAINGDGATVTVTVANANLFVVNASIRISGTSGYNGDHVITAVDVPAGTVQYADAATGAEAAGTAICLFVDPTHGNLSEGGHGMVITGSCPGLNIDKNRIEINGSNGVFVCREMGPHANLSSGVLVIDANVIRDNGEHGIHFDGEFVAASNNSRIVNNWIADNGAGASPYAGVFSETTAAGGGGHHMFLMGNVITGQYHAFYHATEESQTWFLMNYMAANAAGYALFHDAMERGGLLFNHFNVGLIELGVTPDTTNNIKFWGNSGVFITERRGFLQSVGLDINGEYEFNHSCSIKPGWVGLTFYGDNTREINVVFVDETVIRVRVRTTTDNADYTGTASFYWEARV